MSPKNWTQVTGFVPLGFPGAIFCSFCFTKAAGDLRCNYHRQPTHHWIQLDGPMPAHTGPFFLWKLSFLELLLMSIVVPKMPVILPVDHSISFASCIIQSYLYFLLGTTNFFLLAVMPLDHFLAICSPFLLWDPHEWSCLFPTCAGLLGSWVSLCPLPLHPHGQPTGLWPQWYCSLLLGQLALPEALLWRHLHPGAAGFHAIRISVAGLTALTSVSYTCILSTVIRAPTTAEWKKTFFICASHLTVVVISHSCQRFSPCCSTKGPELYHHALPETSHL